MENSTTVEQFDTATAEFVNFWTPCTCQRCGGRTSWEVCVHCVEELEAADDPFADDSIPAPCEVVERAARELEIVLELGESDVRELNALGRTIRNLTGTIEEEKEGKLVMSRGQRFGVWRQLHAARTRLNDLWRTIEFELALDREGDAFTC
ncbi:hypothetical protein EON83_20315 [bacterium]|nr:MAG: hypothetical protein EON83_20315 [bacterium]